MEVHFEPAVQAKLEKIARESGLDAVQLVQDAVAGYVDELAETREMLDSRYDDIKSGKVKLIPGEEVFARLRAKSEPRSGQSASSCPSMISTRKLGGSRRDLGLHPLRQPQCRRPGPCRNSFRFSAPSTVPASRAQADRSNRPPVALHPRPQLPDRLRAR